MADRSVASLTAVTKRLIVSQVQGFIVNRRIIVVYNRSPKKFWLRSMMRAAITLIRTRVPLKMQ